MKIKLMIFSLMVVAGLQGSEEQRLQALHNAMHQAANNRTRDNSCIVLYGAYTFTNIINTLEGSDIKTLLQGDDNRTPQCFVISDDTFVDQKKRRSIARVDIGKDMGGSLDNKFDLNAYHCYELNQRTSINDDDNLINLLQKQKDLVVFNMCDNEVSKKTDCYVDEIANVIGRVPVVICVGPEFIGFNVRRLCRNNHINPIVIHQQSYMSWFFVIGIGLSLAAMLGLICYFKFVR